MGADPTGACTPLTMPSSLPSVGAVRLGADPVDLEQLARRWRDAAVVLHRCSVRLASADPGWWRGPRAHRWWADTVSLAARLRAVTTELDNGARLLLAESEQQRRTSLGDPTATTLRIDPSGDGRFVGSVGEVATPPIAVVLVPGVGTTLADRSRLLVGADAVWRRLAGHAERSDRLGDGGSAAVGVVTWLGYDPPDHVLAGIARRPARDGAAALVGDLERLRAAGAERIVLVGHSYGAVVASHAAALGGRPDELVLLGAPGMGVATPGALELDAGAELWSAAAEGDAVALVARAGLVHGADPAGIARPLPTSLSGHGAYLSDPVLMDALAQVVLADRTPSVRPLRGAAGP